MPPCSSTYSRGHLKLLTIKWHEKLPAKGFLPQQYKRGVHSKNVGFCLRCLLLQQQLLFNSLIVSFCIHCWIVYPWSFTIAIESYELIVCDLISMKNLSLSNMLNLFSTQQKKGCVLQNMTSKKFVWTSNTYTHNTPTHGWGKEKGRKTKQKAVKFVWNLIFWQRRKLAGGIAAIWQNIGWPVVSNEVCVMCCVLPWTQL